MFSEYRLDKVFDKLLPDACCMMPWYCCDLGKKTQPRLYSNPNIGNYSPHPLTFI